MNLPTTQEALDTLLTFNHLSSDNEKINFFKSIIWDYYTNNGRLFPWRQSITPYNVFISEVMLQQTQTYRVAPKYLLFIKELPTFQLLAEASFERVLTLWKGLGYNRRALNLHRAAQEIVTKYHGSLPSEPALIDLLPGIGAATASSICAFAFNKPTVFIETNIRAVFIHFFFQSLEKVHDKDIIPLVGKTVDQENPREWYYALMDYGVFLKKNFKNPSRKSKHHAKQSNFQGSNRQIRGLILQHLLEKKIIHQNDFPVLIQENSERINLQLTALIEEGLIFKKNNLLSIKK